MITYDEMFCLEPKTGECEPEDDTPVVYRPTITKCRGEESKFVFDRDTGKLVHKCSGKATCLKDGKTGYRTEFVISSKCPAPTSKNYLARTYCEFIVIFIQLTLDNSTMYSETRTSR